MLANWNSFLLESDAWKAETMKPKTNELSWYIAQRAAFLNQSVLQFQSQIETSMFRNILQATSSEYTAHSFVYSRAHFRAAVRSASQIP